MAEKLVEVGVLVTEAAIAGGALHAIAHWPDAGGVGDQAAWVVDAFAALSSTDAALEAQQRQLAGR